MNEVGAPVGGSSGDATRPRHDDDERLGRTQLRPSEVPTAKLTDGPATGNAGSAVA